MKRPTRSAAVGLAAALGLTIAVIPGVVSAAGEDTPPPPPQFVPGGTLTLSTTAGSVSFTEEGSTDPTFTQSLGSQGSNCIVPPPPVLPAKELLTFSGRSGALVKPVGYKSNLIGVNEEYAALCNLVDNVAGPGGGLEVLELKLGSGLKNFADVPLVATKASLKLAMGVRTIYTYNKPATVEVTAFAGTEQVGSATLTNGLNGCSSSYGATCTVEVSPGRNFDSLQLKAVKGAFGLQGTTFNLVSEVDKLITCSDASLAEGNTTVKYIGNAADDECGSFGAVLKTSDTEVQLLKPRNVDPSAQFVFDIDWKVDNTEGTPSPTIPDTFIDFEIGGDVEETALLFCSTYPSEILKRNTVSGDFEIVDFPAFNQPNNAFPDFDTDSPEKEFACIDTRSDLSVTSSNITYTDKVFAIGDLKMTPR